MITLRKVLFKVMATTEDDSGFDYFILDHQANGNHRYRCTYHHVRDDVKDLVIDCNCGQDEPDPEKVMEMVWRDMDDYFRAQEDYTARVDDVDEWHTYVNYYNWRGNRMGTLEMTTLSFDDFEDDDFVAIGKCVAYLMDELDYEDQSEAFKIACAMYYQTKHVKAFFGEFWDELTNVDYRYKAFDYNYDKKMVIFIHDHKDEESDEWYRVHAYIDWGFHLKYNQVPGVSVTYASADRNDPDGVGGGAGVDRLYEEENELFQYNQWEHIMALERFHLWNVDGSGMHWRANARYHLKEGNMDAAKRSFGWGLVPSDNYDDDDAFVLLLGQCSNDYEVPEFAERRQMALLNAMWDTILRVAQPHYLEPLKVWSEYCRKGNWKGFFDDTTDE